MGANDGNIRHPGRLRELRFLGCEGMEMEDFHMAIQSLKDVETWETIEQVMVGILSISEV